MVYNHTAEGNHLGPTLCYRGIDNAAYYWLVPDTPRFYENYTGTGNALKLAHPRVLQMVMDSLRYWVEVFHVDGFRFDLATHARPHARRSIRTRAFFAAVRQDPVLANVKLIAEPWDIGLGGYQVGGFPPGWSEWNDVYRKTLRRYWRGDGGLLGDMAGALTGSAAQFRHDGRGPQASVNHVTVHDGFTLADLVSYEHKHNEANKEDNRDGSDDNNSLNCGVEGPTDDPAILERRRLLRRNQLASLLLAQGVPLILAGDEAGNSQGGNNNAYCQDDEIGWVNWSGLGNGRRHDGVRRRPDAAAPALRAASLAALARGPARPTARTTCQWLRPDGARDAGRGLEFPEGRFLAYVLAAAEDGGEPLFIVFNAAAERRRIHPAGLARMSRAGRRVLDTAGEFRAGRADRRSARRQVRSRPPRLDPGVRGQAMIEANPFGPLITPGATSSFASGRRARKRVDAACMTRPARCALGRRLVQAHRSRARGPATRYRSASTARSRCPIRRRASSPTTCMGRAR